MVSGLTFSGLLIALETVPMDTLATRATSEIVGRLWAIGVHPSGWRKHRVEENPVEAFQAYRQRCAFQDENLPSSPKKRAFSIARIRIFYVYPVHSVIF